MKHPGYMYRGFVFAISKRGITLSFIYAELLKRREMFYDNLQTHIWMEIGIDHSDNPYITIKARSEISLVQKG
jgi:hypothetical protein